MFTEIIFANHPDATAEDRYRMINRFLKEHQIATLEFTKKNGDKRIMKVTTDTSLMPIPEAREYHETRVIDWETMPVWSLDSFAWRSFKTMNVISIKEYVEPKRWTLTVDEDPETGDAVLTFPPELLETAGWKEGDTLIWSDRGDGSWQLTKKDK
jgi:WYL_2, Sm-like SH3 beta-barrel fold